MSKELNCWSCRALFTLSEHGNCDGCCWKCGVEIDLAEMDIQPADKQGEQMARMPVERCYDVRTKMIIAFNEAKKAGGDLDDQLDAAYKSALRFSPNSDAQPATAKVDDALRDKLHELLSAVRSINHSPRSEVRMIGDDEPCYAQRKEWVHWLLSICDEAEEVAKLNTAQ